MYDNLDSILLANLYLTSVELDKCKKKKDIVYRFFHKQIKKALLSITKNRRTILVK